MAERWDRERVLALAPDAPATMEELVEREGVTHAIVRVAKPRGVRDQEVFASMRDMITGMYEASLAQLGQLVSPTQDGGVPEPPATIVR